MRSQPTRLQLNMTVLRMHHLAYTDVRSAQALAVRCCNVYSGFAQRRLGVNWNDRGSRHATCHVSRSSATTLLKKYHEQRPPPGPYNSRPTCSCSCTINFSHLSVHTLQESGSCRVIWVGLVGGASPMVYMGLLSSKHHAIHVCSWLFNRKVIIYRPSVLWYETFIKWNLE